MSTPIEDRDGILVKRDDLYEVAGQRGGKARSCAWMIADAKEKGYTRVVTAGSRHSPQVAIVAGIGRASGIEVTAFVPDGPSTPEIESAERNGADVKRVSPGHNTVIKARAKDWAGWNGDYHIPFGMECEAAIQQTSHEAYSVPRGVRRIVVPVGSGMSLAGILYGTDVTVPVLGVMVGADPVKRLDRWAPPWWSNRVTLVRSPLRYDQHGDTEWRGISLDPIYESKCVPFLEPGDLFWLVGRREEDV